MRESCNYITMGHYDIHPSPHWHNFDDYTSNLQSQQDVANKKITQSDDVAYAQSKKGNHINYIRKKLSYVIAESIIRASFLIFSRIRA